METKQHSGNIVECKEIDANGIPVGVVKGYIATWDIDTWSDQFIKGCFEEDLNKLRMSGKSIPLKAEHRNVIGKFSIESIREDERGLYGEGEINLEVQEGKEFYSLAKQKAIADFSIGYTTQEKEFVNGVRRIMKSRVLEGSMVGNPMNEAANITEVKSRSQLPKNFCDMKHLFNPSDITNDKAYLFDNSLQVADIVDGELKLIPRAVIQARIEMIKGLDGMTENEKEQTRRTINCLYSEMGFDEPFENGESKRLNKTEIKSIRKSMLVDILKNTFSKDTSNFIAELVLTSAMEDTAGDPGMLLKELSEMLKS